MPRRRNSDEWLGPPPGGRGRILVVSGPSGSGKTTLVKRLAKDPHIHVSISATTRPPGPTDRQGVDYFFVTREEFENDIRAGRFVEYAQYGGHWYGTPKAQVDDALRRGRWVLLEIEVQGARQVRRLYPDAILAFIEPPSEQELRRRLTRRGRDSAEAIERRLEIAREEMRQKSLYDFTVVNDDLDAAEAELKEQIRARALASS